MSEKRGRKAGQLVPTSRRAQMDALAIGDSVVFIAQNGEKASRLMASIASCYREGLSMGQQGLTQRVALLVVDGEIPTPAVRVTRISKPTAV